MQHLFTDTHAVKKIWKNWEYKRSGCVCVRVIVRNWSIWNQITGEPGFFRRRRQIKNQKTRVQIQRTITNYRRAVSKGSVSQPRSVLNEVSRGLGDVVTTKRRRC